MKPTDEDRCERAPCPFIAEPVYIESLGAFLMSRYCGDACRDAEWMRRGLETAEPSRDVAEALRQLQALCRLLDARKRPSEIGALLGGEQ
ncbi:hypothetical protein [Streptomyces sp. NPDC056669]|uniref:hypothetical protein n=1 Tax=Streptomyces sp. NPDC056669 TaxID=3345903 RepID=UPI00369DADC0